MGSLVPEATVARAGTGSCAGRVAGHAVRATRAALRSGLFSRDSPDPPSSSPHHKNATPHLPVAFDVVRLAAHGVQLAFGERVLVVGERGQQVAEPFGQRRSLAVEAATRTGGAEESLSLWGACDGGCDGRSGGPWR